MLKQLCQRVHALPESFRITPGSVTLHDSNRRPEATGGSADIWKASYMGRTVALKVIRDYEDDLYCEAVIWKHLRHPNITPFYGIDTGSFALSFVSKWMPHGTITSYLKHNATAQRLGFISDVSEGLKYLHDIGIVHGDIKGSNILVNEKLVACLCDFGLAALSYEEKLPTRSVVKGSVRYMAPEIMDPEEFGLGRAILTPQSDVYSLGMTVWEMFAGCPPFHELRRDPVVIRRVVQGLRPERPEAADALGLTDRLWELLERCWHVKWDHRPDMDAILEYVTGQPKVAFLRPSRSPAGPRPSGTPPSHDPARPLPYATLIASSISSLRPHPDSHAAPIDALRSRTNLSSRRDTSRPSDDGELPTSVTTDIFHPLDVHQQPLPGYPEDITRKHGPKDPVTPELHIRLNEIPDKVSADDLISTGRLVVQAKFPAEKPLHRPKLSPLQFPKSLYATPAPPSSTRSSTRGPATSEQLPGPSPSPSSSSGHKGSF
ncbi:kinase-like protein [Obba rivulosa]|uniref:Kinase-like protein n=1 Tax=Obba rivulosa TaxID=1052685 RepID=A0A8E2B1P1_9APHY|nr:kinase-like protein [Obba rivulosa]